VRVETFAVLTLLGGILIGWLAAKPSIPTILIAALALMAGLWCRWWSRLAEWKE
jgi:hypothetical protein